MSDTPRTDSQTFEVEEPNGGTVDISVVTTGFARQLERENRELLDALKQSFQAMTSVTVKTRSDGEKLQKAAIIAARALSKAEGGAE